MGDVTVKMPQPLGLFAGELFKRAEDYSAAFERLANSHGRELSFPMYFLFAHGLEILFKAFLAAKEIPKRTLSNKPLGHNLLELHKRCVELGLPIVADLEAYVATFAEMNRDHDFRYPSGYILSLPRPPECLAIFRATEAVIKPVVIYAHTTAAVRFASGTHHLRGEKIQWSD